MKTPALRSSRALKVVEGSEKNAAPPERDSPRSVAALLENASKNKRPSRPQSVSAARVSPFALPKSSPPAIEEKSPRTQGELRIPSARSLPASSHPVRKAIPTITLPSLAPNRLRERSLAISRKASVMVPAAVTALVTALKALRPEPLASPGEGAQSLSHRIEHAMAGDMRRGARVLVVAGIIGFGWAGLVPLAGAVVVSGSLVVSSSVKKVQHPVGGVVAEIFVRNGSKVEAGDKLLRLDETSSRANLQVIARQLDEVRVRIARLTAERDGAAEPSWPQAMAADVDVAERDRLLASERDFFLSRTSGRRNEKELAESRLRQLENQIAGLEAQYESNTRQMSITAGELKSAENLLAEKLVTIQRVTTLQREAARLQGVDGQLASQIAETRTKVNEARIQAIQSEQNYRSEVMRELGEAEAKQGELMERRLAAEDQQKRTIIRAPYRGTVHDLTIHTSGGVVSAAETLMTVVPDGDALEVDARLMPDKIDQVRAGQSARVRLSAFNMRTTPELEGAVDYVSPDIVRDGQSSGYYDVRISLPQEQLRRLGGLQLVPGMPAEVFLETESRTMLSYLFKPLSDQLSRGFRER